MPTSSDVANNHGPMSFVGRDPELAIIHEYWKGTYYADGLRALVVVGEAGVGKSRLISEAITRIELAGGVVIHARLYPESTSSTTSAVAEALWWSSSASSLLGPRTIGAEPPLIESIRRLVRLRAVLLVIEDIHLLNGGSVNELRGFLRSLSDQPLSLLFATRTGQLAAKGALSDIVTGEIQLAGLDRKFLQQLWMWKFDEIPAEVVLDRLEQVTRGNPLAVRAALRAAEVIFTRHVRASNSNKLADLLDALSESAASVAGGMIADLSTVELTAARQLACLGEVFARETACAVIDDGDAMLTILLKKGIIASPSQALRPLHATNSTPSGFANYPESQYPLFAFGHTLLHLHLSMSAEGGVEKIVRALSADLPFYSLHAITTLSRLLSAQTLTAYEITRCVNRMLNIAGSLDNTPQAGLRISILDIAEALSNQAESDGILSRGELEARILWSRLLINSYGHSTEFSDDKRQLVRRLLILTAADGSDPELRLGALVFAFRHANYPTYDSCTVLRSEIWELTTLNPRLRFTRQWVYYLQFALDTRSNNEIGGKEEARWVEERYNELMSASELSPGFKSYAERRISGNLLFVFETEDEMKLQLKRADALAAAAQRNYEVLSHWNSRIDLLATCGEFDLAIGACHEWYAYASSHGLEFVPHRYFADILRVAFDGDLDALNEHVQHSNPPLWPFEVSWLLIVSILLFDHERARAYLELVSGTTLYMLEPCEILLANTDLASLSKTLKVDRFQALIDFVASADSARAPSAFEEAESLLAIRVYLMPDTMLVCYSVFSLVRAASARIEDVELSERFRAMVRRSLMDILRWHAKHELVAFLRAAIEAHADFLDVDELDEWRTRAQSIQATRDARAANKASDGKLQISLVGTIATRTSAGRAHHIQGRSQRALLGLLIADRMLLHRLTFSEMMILIARDENDPKRARKALNLAVHRLRETLGHDAIVIDDHTPRLNMEHVRVDLLDASDFITQAHDATRTHSLARASLAIKQALQLTRGDVTYPGLYDDFFEASRSDFEARLRSGILDVSRALLHEGDAMGAEGILRLAFDAMPGDEEVAELLRSTLQVLDRRVEAERVKMRS